MGDDFVAINFARQFYSEKRNLYILWSPSHWRTCIVNSILVLLNRPSIIILPTHQSKLRTISFREFGGIQTDWKRILYIFTRLPALYWSFSVRIVNLMTYNYIHYTYTGYSYLAGCRLSVTHSLAEGVRRRVTLRVGRPGKNNKLYFVKTFHAEDTTPFNRCTISIALWTESFRSPCHPPNSACIFIPIRRLIFHSLAAHDEQSTMTIPVERKSRLESEKSYIWNIYYTYIYYIQDVCVQVQIISIIGS